MKCFCSLRRQALPKALTSRSYSRRGIWLTTPQRAFWLQRTLSSLQKGGDVVSETILQMTPNLSASSLHEIAKQPPDGALQAGANITALWLASAFLASGLSLVGAMSTSEVSSTLN